MVTYEKQMIYLRNGLNLMMRKIPPVQPYHIYAHITYRFPCCFYKRRDVFPNGTLPTNICMLTDACKLLYAAKSADNGEVTYFNMSCKLHTICKDHVVAYHTIVCYM